jgi:hypothetical protein
MSGLPKPPRIAYAQHQPHERGVGPAVEEVAREKEPQMPPPLRQRVVDEEGRGKEVVDEEVELKTTAKRG